MTPGGGGQIVAKRFDFAAVWSVFMPVLAVTFMTATFIPSHDLRIVMKPVTGLRLSGMPRAASR